MRRSVAFACVFAAALLSAPLAAQEATDLASFFGGGSLHLRLRLAGIDQTFLEEFRAPEVTRAAWAAGPGFDYRTASWRGLGLDLSACAAQKIRAPAEKGGTALLAPGEKSFAVLAVASLRGEWPAFGFRLFRQKLDTPFVASRDSRLAPVTFEALAAEAKPVRGLSLFVYHVTQIKEWNSTGFVTTGEYVGLDTRMPVTILGATWAPSPRAPRLQAWDFYLAGVGNIAYAQADVSLPLGKDVGLGVSLQGVDDRSAGAAALGDIRAGLLGALASVSWKGITARVAGTIADRRHAIFNPFSAYPGFTTVMEEDNDLAGERAWLVGVKLDLAMVGLPGVTAGWDHAKSWIPDPPLGMSHRDQTEDDIVVAAELPGALRGFLVKGRAAWVRAALDTGLLTGRSLRDLRLWVDYRLDVKLTPVP